MRRALGVYPPDEDFPEEERIDYALKVYEKHTLKYVFMIGLLAYLIISNLSQAGEYQNPRSQSKVV